MIKEDIEQFCRPFFGGKGNLESVESLSGGAVNETYKIVWEEIPYILRLYTRDPQLAELERNLYLMIEEFIPVPKLLYSEGSAALFSYVNKKRLDQVQDARHSYHLGELLSRIHGFRFPKAGLFGPELEIAVSFAEGSSPYLDYILDHFDRSARAWSRLGDERGEQILRFIECEQDFFPKIEGGGKLVHSDFKPVNLLWDECEGFTILDWEFAHSGHPLLDFGILLRHDRQFPFDCKAFIKGYKESGGEVPDEWERMARITDLINLIQLLERPKPDFPFLFEAVDRILKI